MKKLLDLVLKRKWIEVYNDDDLFFTFHSICVANVLFRTKWKRHRLVDMYDKYTDESDEAFAFVILENNVQRYLIW